MLNATEKENALNFVVSCVCTCYNLFEIADCPYEGGLRYGYYNKYEMGSGS